MIMAKFGQQFLQKGWYVLMIFKKGEFTVFDKAVMMDTKDTVALANPMGILKEPSTGLLWLYSDSYYLYKIQHDSARIEALPIANVQSMYFDSQKQMLALHSNGWLDPF